MNATELKNKFSETGLIINGGALSIWNIPFGKMGDNFYKINKIENDEVENILNIETEYPKLKIWNPTNIIEVEAKNEFWPPTIEIEKADRILLTYKSKNVDYFIDIDYQKQLINSNAELTENGVTFKELKIRFVGIYDTVPHHGVSQANDIADLGLNTIATKADFTVHLVAGDEHRLNFSLVDIRSIIGKKGGGISKKGVELYLPGVHCDVGGSYVEGRGEVNERLMVSNFSFLELDLTKERERLIQEGWFKLKDKNGPKEDEIYIHNDSLLRSTINQKIARVLTTDRKHLSNQYSYIPLHIMVDFCIKKGLVLDTGKIEKDYKFKTNSFSDAALLTRIEKQLKAYAAGTGERLKLVSPPIHHENDYVTSPENSAVARLEYEERIRAGQAKLDKIADDLNRDLKTLRNKYLHWNATYGEGFKKTASQANQPNFVGGKRKREIRG